MLYCDAQLGQVEGAELSALIEAVTNRPCPGRVGFACPLEPPAVCVPRPRTEAVSVDPQGAR